MKWYFGLSEASIDRDNHAWADLIWCAVRSAKQNTTLTPIMLYDGSPSTFTRALELEGVTVVHLRVPFFESLAAHGGDNKSYIAITSGCYLRTQIPRVEKDDQYVLYTDCDVLFHSDPNFEDLKPEFFAAAGEHDLEDYRGNMNSGVMLINCHTMRETLDDFEAFIRNNLHIGLDQDHYRAFYSGKWDRLPNRFNWKPYWGQSDEVVILHWHGPKPIWVRRFFGLYADAVADVWRHLVNANISAYWAFLQKQRIYSRLPELQAASSSVRLAVKSMSRERLTGYVYNKAHKHSPVSLNMLVDYDVRTVVHCGTRVLGVDVFGYDGHIYYFDIDLSELKSGAIISFTDLQGQAVSIHHAGHTPDGLRVPS